MESLDLSKYVQLYYKVVSLFHENDLGGIGVVY